MIYTGWSWLFSDFHPRIEYRILSVSSISSVVQNLMHCEKFRNIYVNWVKRIWYSCKWAFSFWVIVILNIPVDESTTTRFRGIQNLIHPLTFICYAFKSAPEYLNASKSQAETDALTDQQTKNKAGYHANPRVPIHEFLHNLIFIYWLIKTFHRFTYVDLTILNVLA